MILADSNTIIEILRRNRVPLMNLGAHLQTFEFMTSNQRHYSRIPDLALTDWRDPPSQ